MKSFILLILLLFTANAQSVNSNVNMFKTNVVVKPLNNNLEVITYVEIYNRNLQFLKKENFFESSFDLDISIISKNGNKIAEKSFSDSIKVKNFTQTVSKSNPRLYIHSFEVPNSEFNVNFSLKDLDTKLVGKKQKIFSKNQLPTGKYSKIYEPIFVKNKKGNWKIVSDRYPIKINEIIPIQDNIEFLQYIKFKKGEFSVNFSIISDRKTVWSESFEGDNDKEYFSKLVRIPTTDLNSNNLKLKIQAYQNGKVTSKSFKLRFKNDLKTLLSLNNVSSALEQMSYILTIDEKKELRKLKNSEKEKFFKKVWAIRDPDKTTKENELMLEYFRRVAFAEENFSRGTSSGWRSDMGMIYILFGKPDDISKSVNPQQSYNYETWYYYQINREFSFIDDFGFGDYRLRNPFVY